jgi:SAM-dependent methyltransferase
MTDPKKRRHSTTFRILFCDDIVPRCVPLTYRLYLLAVKWGRSLGKRLPGKKSKIVAETQEGIFTPEACFGSTRSPVINKTFMEREDDLAEPRTHALVVALEGLRAKLQESGLKNTSAAGSFKAKDFLPEKERNKLWENTWLLTHAMPKPSDIVLDLGGASTLFSFYVASLGCPTHVLDYDWGQHGLIYNARYVARCMGWNMRLYNRDLSRLLPFQDGSFDKIYCVCVLEHLSSDVRRKTMSEIKRVLKPGGLAAMTFDYDTARNDPWFDKGLRYGLKDQLFRDILEPAGMKIVGNQIFVDNCPSSFFLGSLFLKK